jgi:hypothetical protein
MFVEANPETLQGGLVGDDNARGARAGAKPCMCSHKFGRDHRSEDRFAVAYLPSRALGSDDRGREGLPLLNASPPFPAIVVHLSTFICSTQEQERRQRCTQQTWQSREDSRAIQWYGARSSLIF